MLNGSEIRPPDDGAVPFDAVIVTRYYPYTQRSGALIYTAQMIELWASLAREVHVFCVEPRGSIADDFQCPHENVTFHFGRSSKSKVWHLFASMEPKSGIEFASAFNRRRLSELLKNVRPKYLIMDHIGSSWAIAPFLGFRRQSRTQTLLLYLSHNEEFSTRLSIAKYAPIPSNLAHYVDALKLYVREKRVLAALDLLSCNTETDRLAYSKRLPVPSIVLPPVYGGPAVASRVISMATPRRAVVVSNFVWSAKLVNLTAFLDKAASLLLEQGIEVQVVGRMHRDNLEKFRRGHPRVEFLGEVESVEPYLASARIGLLIDLAGGGFKHTALNYVFNRLPVVTLSAAVADEMLRRYFVIASTLEELTAQATSLIDDIPRLNELQESAYRNLEVFLNQDSNRRTLAAALERLDRDRCDAQRTHTEAGPRPEAAGKCR